MASGEFSMLGDSAFIDIKSVDLVVSCLNQTSDYGYLILWNTGNVIKGLKILKGRTSLSYYLTFLTTMTEPFVQ